jgi:hypothetical protein
MYVPPPMGSNWGPIEDVDAIHSWEDRVGARKLHDRRKFCFLNDLTLWYLWRLDYYRQSLRALRSSAGLICRRILHAIPIHVRALESYWSVWQTKSCFQKTTGMLLDSQKCHSINNFNCQTFNSLIRKFGIKFTAKIKMITEQQKVHTTHQSCRY